MKLSWSDFENYTNKLISNINDDGYTPDVIVAVGISGLVPAALVAKGLKLTDIETITISSYDTDNQPGEPRIVANHLSDFLKNKKLLVVDDIVSSGKTFDVVKKQLELFIPKQVKFSAPVVSEFVCKQYPDYWGESIMRSADDFITFPWDN